MTKTPTTPPTWKGKSLGLVAVVTIQLLIGCVHLCFGAWLLFASLPLFDVYALYTALYGLLTLLFSVGLWRFNRWGYIGTVAVCLFVIAVDTLVLLNLPSIPGIPKPAGAFEIPYSIALLTYLLQPKTLKNQI